MWRWRVWVCFEYMEEMTSDRDLFRHACSSVSSIQAEQFLCHDVLSFTEIRKRSTTCVLGMDVFVIRPVQSVEAVAEIASRTTAAWGCAAFSRYN